MAKKRDPMEMVGMRVWVTRECKNYCKRIAKKHGTKAEIVGGEMLINAASEYLAGDND